MRSVEGLEINGALGRTVKFMRGFEQGEKKKPSGAWNQYGEAEMGSHGLARMKHGCRKDGFIRNTGMEEGLTAKYADKSRTREMNRRNQRGGKIKTRI